MAHFAIAEDIYNGKPSGHFLLGSIAPDAIHTRINATRIDKGFTHLVSNGHRLPNVEKLKQFCFEYLDKNSEDEWKDYVLGYFAHIYADLRWTETVYHDFEQNFRGERNEIRKYYNRDVSKIEFILLRTERWVEKTKTKLIGSNAYTLEPFILQKEVNQYRDLKLEWLDNDNNEPNTNPEYITEEIVRNFIKSTSNEVNELIRDWDVMYFEEGRNIR